MRISDWSSDVCSSDLQLDVRFGKGDEAVLAVRDLSLAVRRGESFGLVGESGSGKSTVLRAVAGLARDWTGRIAVERSEERRVGKGCVGTCSTRGSRDQ